MEFAVLLGPKHSGKTSVGQELARRLLLPFYDLDALVEARTGQSPRALYRAGPDIFRGAETAALADLVETLENFSAADNPSGTCSAVAATGGGIIDNPQAMDILEKAGCLTIYLEVSAETAWSRIAVNGIELPPFLQEESPAASREKHRALHERRAASYRSCARVVISADGKTQAELAEEIYRNLVNSTKCAILYNNMSQERLFSAILENVHDGIIALDEGLSINFVNPAALKMSCWEKAPLNQHAVRAFTLLESKSLSNLINKKLPQDGDPFLFKGAIYKCGHNTLIVDGSIARIPKENNAGTYGYVIVMRDISEMRKLNATLDYHVSHDALTGLANREGFSMLLEDILDSVKRIGKNAALLQIDIDTYNEVKIESGEAGGNALLNWFTAILQSQVKQQDLPARLGGCVFSLVLFDCTMEKAEGVAKRIHHAAAEGFAFEGKKFPISVSIGIVPIHEKAPFAVGLLSDADTACSSAKKTGGGKTIMG